MVDSVKQSGARSMNPGVLLLQKLGLELKCPICLDLLKRPYLLPCDHIFCNSCLPKTTQFGSDCPVCKTHFVGQDLRPVPFIENIVSIYRSLDAAFCANMFQSPASDTKWVLERCPGSIGTDCTTKLIKESFEAAWEDNSCSGRSTASLMSNKVAQVPHNCSVQNEVQKNDVGDNCSVPIDVKNNEYAMVVSGDGCNGEHNVSSPRVSYQIRARVLQECGTVQVNINQVEQLSPGSPPSFGDNKESENDSNDQERDNSPQNYQTAKLAKQNSDRMKREMHDTSASGTEKGHLRDPKRHKKLNYGPLGMYANSFGHIKPIISQTKNLGTSHSHLELNCVVPHADYCPPAIVDDSFAEKTRCGFCQSSRITEGTGPMLHYVNGKLVVGDEATLSKAINVHRTCIDWAPQVYYVDDGVENLKTELARGSKLKCSRCGMKGAALGCYVKSCRKTYHAPCAMQIANCRWDDENYLMLCPDHSALKFPNEKSKSENNGLKIFPDLTPIAQERPNFSVGSNNGAKRLVFCGSALSSEDKCLLVEFGSMIGVPVTKFWRSDVTHVIAATDTGGACTRTLKVLMAILNGRWVLTVDWIKACMESMHPVDEEPYEVCLDNHGCCDGPKTGRLSALDNAPKLFNGLSFYFAGDFLLGYKEDLQNLVIAAGGTILDKEAVLVEQICDQVASSRTMVVYNLDPPQGCQLGEEVSIIWERLNEAQDLAAKIGSQVIGHTWLLESIAAYKLQPFFS